jgi:tetratricopeptide (TPR) repeat protein
LASAGLVWGCGGAHKTAQAPLAVSEQHAAPQGKPAAEQFEAWSRSIEKIGANETVDPARLSQELSAIVAADANYLPARYNLLALDALGGHQAQADAAFAQMAEAHPDFAPAVENAAAVWVSKGQIDKATQAYEAVIAAQPKNQTSRLALARLKLIGKHYKEAIALCRAVLARQADAIEAFRVLAHSYVALGDLPMAELIVSRGLRVAPKDVALHEVLADLFLARGDTTLAVAKLKEVVTMAPNRPFARARLATVAQSYFDFGSAAQQYEAILAQEPNHVPTEVCLAVAYKSLGRFAEADTLYQKVLAQDAENLDALWDRSILCQKQLAHYDDAAAALQRYMALAPRNAPGRDQVEARLGEIARLKADVAAQAERQAHDKARLAAIDAACAAQAAQKPVDGAAIGTEPERIEAAWQQLAEAQKQAQAGNVALADAAAACGFAMLPKSLSANTQACAPMHVAWTLILYQLGRIAEATVSIQAGLACDAKNPDAQLIDQQLKELAAQSQAAGEGSK